MPTFQLLVQLPPCQIPPRSRSEDLHLKFTKPVSQKMVLKLRFTILLLKIYNAVIVQSLKFTQKVTVNHMLPFPSALYTFVILVYNKQTNKQTNLM